MIQSRFFHALILGICSFVVLIAVSIGIVRHMLGTPASNSSAVFLYIEQGQGVAQVARQARELGIVKAPWHFKLAVRVMGLERALFSGEYEIPTEQTLRATLEKIRKRDVHLRRIVVPEGQSAAEIMRLLNQSFGLVMEGTIAPPEGSLLPNTYFYERGDTAQALLSRMENAMNTALEAAWHERSTDLPFRSMREALVLASIVEKETAIPTERPLVAAVFVNRLRKGMRLQSDPTVIYGITGGLPLGRPLSRADLRQVTAFNTYRTGGLPPTPIANPGIDSIQAVLNPADVPYLYFVADGSGGHAFASTLQEHNRNVRRWRQIERAEGAGS